MCLIYNFVHLLKYLLYCEIKTFENLLKTYITLFILFIISVITGATDGIGKAYAEEVLHCTPNIL